MNACPDDGKLRAMLDEAVERPDRGHLADGAGTDAWPNSTTTIDAADMRAHAGACGMCTARLAALRDDAHVAAAAVGSLTPAWTVDAEGVERDLRRLRTHDGSGGARRWLRVAAGVGVITLVAVALTTSSGRQALADALSVFRAERLQVVTFDPDQIRSDLGALAALGEVRGSPAEPVPVDDLDAAAAIAGFTPAQPSVAPTGQSSIVAAPPHVVEIAFSQERAADLPADLDGAVLRVDVPGVVVQRWAGSQSGGAQGAANGGGTDIAGSTDMGAHGEETSLPGAMVAEAGQLEIDVTGGNLEDLRSWLLLQPEVSADLRRQLQAITDWRTTLPVPVPVDGVAWREVAVSGHEGVEFGDESGLAAAVIWPADGRIRAVGGMLTLTEAHALAEDIQTP